jgi:hypothetical protein
MAASEALGSSLPALIRKRPRGAHRPLLPPLASASFSPMICLCTAPTARMLAPQSRALQNMATFLNFFKLVSFSLYTF